MMASRQQIEHAMETHFTAWNARDRQAWVANFAADVLLEDPVGGPRKRGRDALEKTWERSFAGGQEWMIEPRLKIVCGNEVALQVRSTGRIKGEQVVIDGIEIYTIDEAGKIAQVRTFFRAPEGVQLDPYFSPA